MSTVAVIIETGTSIVPNMGQASQRLRTMTIIGIISHAEELKKQTDLQIFVEKTNNGSSIMTNFSVYS